jgi:hypothetical protein
MQNIAEYVPVVPHDAILVKFISNYSAGQSLSRRHNYITWFRFYFISSLFLYFSKNQNLSK